MPGRIKLVPQDSTEWDRTDTGHSTDKGSTRVISILTLVLNPLVRNKFKVVSEVWFFEGNPVLPLTHENKAQHEIY